MYESLEGTRQAARTGKEQQFTPLLHHVNIDLLRLACFELKRKAAPGVDGVTWDEYGVDLEGNLASLHSRVHRGAYRALPSRQRYIPKPDCRQRPLGRPSKKTYSSCLLKGCLRYPLLVQLLHAFL